MTEKLLTAKEAAAAMQVSLPTLYGLFKRPGFPVLKIGKKKGYRISETGLKEWIETEVRT